MSIASRGAAAAGAGDFGLPSLDPDGADGIEVAVIENPIYSGSETEVPVAWPGNSPPVSVHSNRNSRQQVVANRAAEGEPNALIEEVIAPAKAVVTTERLSETRAPVSEEPRRSTVFVDMDGFDKQEDWYYAHLQQPGSMADSKPPYVNWWSSEIFDCGKNVDICMVGLLCPWYLLYRAARTIDNPNSEALRRRKPRVDRQSKALQICKALFYSLCCCIGHMFLRKKVRSQFRIEGTWKNDFIVTCLCGSCSGCQEARELQQIGMSIGNTGKVVDKSKLPPFYVKKMRREAIARAAAKSERV